MGSATTLITAENRNNINQQTFAATAVSSTASLIMPNLDNVCSHCARALKTWQESEELKKMNTISIYKINLNLELK